MLWIVEKVTMVRKTLCTKDTPRQMAAGIACGVVLGLLPKGNLLAIAVATCLLATRMSLATGMLTASLISILAPVCDPLTHRLGEWILTTGLFEPLWRNVARLPLAAWTAFNNTVVMGSLTLALALMYPVYRLGLPWMERLQRHELEKGKTRLGRSSSPDESDSRAALVNPNTDGPGTITQPPPTNEQLDAARLDHLLKPGVARQRRRSA